MTEIASLSLDAIRANGEKFALDLAISAPFISKRYQTWVCSLTLYPLLPGSREVAGENSVQALSLTLRTARSILEQFTDDGGMILLGGDIFPIEACLGPKL